MEPRDRPHRGTTSSSGASELFICFTSRPSATSSAAATTMRVPSAKSLMSPARTAAPSLSSSLSRRLRSSGSVKAGEQSPMFPAVAAAAARKKGCSFEAAEPSSPKVTCIGQVRVKSKKKKNKCKAAVAAQGAAMARSRSQRRSGGEASFRRAGVGEGERECRPWGFCEALRSFGSEINCFAPCRGGRSSFCSSSNAGFEVEKEEEKRRKGSSCGGAVFGWMMAVQESEEGKGGEVVGLVVQENGRREVSLVVEKVEEEKEVVEVEVEVVEESRASVCVPPKNALLLMRCRSDPVRMAALATRFWGSPAAAKVGAEQEEEGEEEQQHKQEEEAVVLVETTVEKVEEEEQAQEEREKEEEEEEEGEEEETVEGETAIVEKEKNAEEKQGEEKKEEEKLEALEENGEEEKNKDESFTESAGDLPPLKEEKRRRSKAKEREMRRSRSNKEKERKRTSFSNEKESRRHSFSTERDVRRPSFSSSSTMDAERRHSWSFSKKKSKEEEKEENHPTKTMDSEKGGSKVEAGEKKRELPDCLLLMMYEPKLSMEVSKETWVCSTDFLQWRPKEVVPAPAAAAVEEQTPDPVPPLSEEVEKKLAGTAEPAQVAAAAAAAAAQVAAYEPFVLTRCKSEPMRSSARLAPDACFWKSRHQPIGAAGIGF